MKRRYHVHHPQACLLLAPVYMPIGRFNFGGAPVYMHRGRMPVYFRARSARVHAHRPQVGLLSGAKRPCTSPLAADWFTFGHEAPVYIPTGTERPFNAHRPQAGLVSDAKRPCTWPAGLLSGAKRPCTCPPAIDWFTFGRKAPVYMPTDLPQAGFLQGAKSTCPPAAGMFKWFTFGPEAHV